MLHYVPPPLINDAWTIIFPGLEKVTSHSCDGDLPVEIRAALDTSVACLFLCFENDSYAGFCVLRPEQNVLGQKGIHVWAAYYTGKTFESGIAEVEAMARDQGFSQLTFSSPRKGWARRLKDWQPTYQIFRKKL